METELEKRGLEALLARKGFAVVDRRVYPLVGAPTRDFLLKFLPLSWRGDHQRVMAQKS